MKEVKEEKKTKKKTVKTTKEATKKTKVIEEKKETKPKRVKKTTSESKEVNESKVLLNEKDQGRYVSLCKAARVITKIVRICLMIVIPFIFIFLFIIPIIFKKVEINSNIIKIDDASIVLHDDSISFKIADDIKTMSLSEEEVNNITRFLMNNSKDKIVLIIELSLLTAGVIVVLYIYLLSALEKLLDNLRNEKVPFTDENSNSILRMAKLFLTIKIIDFVSTLILFGKIGLELEVIVEILVAFIVFYVFNYATEMQKLSNTKMCK